MTTPGLIGFEVFTLFPGAIEGFVGAGLLGKAIEQGRVTVRCTDFRDFTSDRHRTVDDAPFGGGAGMVIKPGPVVDAMEHVARERGPFHRILLTPSAPRFDQAAAARLCQMPRIGLLCGRYEGIDDRVREHFVDECLSLGDFVLGGGEVAALVIIEAVSRLVEGVVGNPESVHTDSFGRTGEAPLLEHPHYTRPAEFRGHAVPPVLLGGDHAAIARWRHASALRRTWALRPDLRARPRLSPGHPVYVAVPPSALPHAAELAAVVRRHSASGLVVVGPRARPQPTEGSEAAPGRAAAARFETAPGRAAADHLETAPGRAAADHLETAPGHHAADERDDPLPRWLAATGGRVSVAVFGDAKALRRRLHRGAAAEPRFVRVVEPGTPPAPGPAELGPPCERPEALLDLLYAASAAAGAPSGEPGLGAPGASPAPPALGPLVLWAYPEPPPPGMPIHAIYAPPGPSAAVPHTAASPSHAAPSTPDMPVPAASSSDQGHDLTSRAEPEIARGLAIHDAIADISRPSPRPAALVDAALTGLRDHG